MAVVGSSAQARRNSVLAGLTSSGASLPALELVDLDNHDVVHEAGEPATTVLFPVSCVVSVALSDADDAVEVTTVGREGLVGLSGLLGTAVHDTGAVCRVPGRALRLPLSAARKLLVDDAAGLAVLHRYIGGHVEDLRRRIACNRVHSSEARCASWLVKTSDRVAGVTFELTHTTLARMLGVRRATVTESLALLQQDGVVRSSRGVVTVLDRAGLEAAACDCYAAFGRALPLTSA